MESNSVYEHLIHWTDRLTLHQPVYNASLPDGGNPLEMDVNAPYKGLEFHYVYQLIMGGLVFLIIPGQLHPPMYLWSSPSDKPTGIGLLYGGMARRKSSLAMIFQSFTIMALIAVQWIFWGYTLSFSRTGRSGFIGDFSNFLLWDVCSVLSRSYYSPTLMYRFHRSWPLHLLAPRSYPRSSFASTNSSSAPVRL